MAQWLRLPGTASHNATTPDTAALDLTGDLELICDVALNDWTPAATSQLINKYVSGTNSGYGLRIDTTGTVRLFFGNGTASHFIQSTAATGLTDSTRHTIRATLDVNNGAAGFDVTFYVDGVQLGSVVTTATAESVAANNGDLAVGSSPFGGEPSAGRVYAAQVLDGIGGTVVADFAADDFAVGDTATDTAVDSTGKTWTINGAGSIIEADIIPNVNRSSIRDIAVTSGDGVGTPFAANYPNTVAGDSLYAFATADTAMTMSATGWTVIAQAAPADTWALLQRDTPASGSEGGTTFNLDKSQAAARDTHVIAISVPSGGTPEVQSSSGSVSSVDWPAITPTPGLQRYLFVLFAVMDLNRWIVSGTPASNWQFGTAVSSSRPSWFTFEDDTSTVDPAAMATSAAGTVGWSTIAIPVDDLDASAWPRIVGEDFDHFDPALTVAIPIPAGNVGDTLVIEVATNEGGNATGIAASATGWDVLDSQVETGNFVSASILTREADGTEGATVTVTVASPSGRYGNWTIRRWENVDYTKLAAAMSDASAATVDFPALTPADGSDNIAWVAGASINNKNYVPRTWPPLYGSRGLWTENTNVGTDTTASRIISGVGWIAQASADPATITLDSSKRHVAWTMALYPAAAPPAAPANPAAVADSASQITVTWDDVADETGFRVERSPDGVGSWADVSGNLAAGTTSYQDTGLTASTQYFYRVVAFNGAGDSSPSSTVNATTDAAGGGNRMGGSGAIRKPPRRSRA